MQTKLESGGNHGDQSQFRAACQGACQKVLAQLQAAKTAILAESRAVFKLPEPRLRLALYEAETLAWQTLYPQLTFPVLAMEKIQAVADRSRPSQSVRFTRSGW